MSGKAALYILIGVALGLAISSYLQSLVTAEKVERLAAQPESAPLPKLSEGVIALLPAAEQPKRRIGFV